MDWKPISKSTRVWPVPPNLLNYKETRASFTWDDAWQLLDGLPDNRGLNIAHEAVDRHANGPDRDHLAIRWLGKQGEQFDFTFGDLMQLSNRFANVLQTLGVGKGDKVFVLCGRIPDL